MNIHSQHSRKLEEIDMEQRLHEQQEPDDNNNVFSRPIVEALSVQPAQPQPMLSQEELDIERPSHRVNWTAVICTAIIAASATIILCVAKPWEKGGEADGPVVAHAQKTVVEESIPKQTEPKNVEPEQETVKTPEPETTKTNEATANIANTASGSDPTTTAKLPVEIVTATGTTNPYNNVRLVNASTRLLTKEELQQMNKTELYLARNAIFARHGYQFNNKELGEFFEHQTWFKAADIKIDDIPFTKTELENIKLIKAREAEL